MARLHWIVIHMAIAHVCLSCGFDLARVRPVREPHYGLPLVLCPNCRSGCVRRQHPIRSRWRRHRKVDLSLRVLAFQIFMILAFGALTTAAVITILIEGVSGSRNPHSDDFFWLCVWVFGVLGLATGAWLTAGFGHLRLWQAWLGWTMTLSLPPLAIVLISMAVGELPPGFSWEDGPPETLALQLAIEGMVTIVGSGMVVVLGIMACALAGIPFGLLIVRSLAWARRRMWRWHRKRRRLASAV